jgi:glycosyltransferase involved in cell wall biosynthesis
MSTRPLVSIAMPVYNCQSTVGEAVASIVAQTFTDWELIVIDDGSTDKTIEIVKGFSDPRIRTFESGQNKQLPTRLNESFQMARGELFARMDGDDVSYPDRLALQVEYLNKHPEVDLLGGSILIFGEDGRAAGTRAASRSHRQILGKPWRLSSLAHVTWMGRREWFLRNPYDETISHAQDRELLTRTRRASTFAGIPDILVAVRESTVKIKKQIPARRQLCKTFLREGLRQRSPSLICISAPLELAKLGFDLLAIKSGLHYRLLRHRVPPVAVADAQRWEEVRELTKRSLTSQVVGRVPSCCDVCPAMSTTPDRADGGDSCEP